MYATVSRGGGFCKWLRSYLVCVCVSIVLCSYESCAPSSLLPRQSPSGESSAGVDKRKLVYVQNISKQSILPSELCWFSLILCLLMYILFPLLPPLPSPSPSLPGVRVYCGYCGVGHCPLQVPGWQQLSSCTPAKYWSNEQDQTSSWLVPLASDHSMSPTPFLLSPISCFPPSPLKVLCSSFVQNFLLSAGAVTAIAASVLQPLSGTQFLSAHGTHL